MPALPATRAPRLRLVLVLGLAAVVAVLALVPYLKVLMPQRLAAIPLPLPLVAAAQALQAGVLCAALAWLGLWSGERYGLSAPWLRAWVYRQPWPEAGHRWRRACALGVAAALAVLVVDALYHGARLSLASPQLDLAWRGALASFYGGIVEEVLCRLFLVSLLVWLLARIGGGARPWMFAVAIVLAALIFGASHLPAAFASGTPHELRAIARIVALNMIVGVPLGWLFWKHGLEHAMLAHFSADLVLHVAAPLLGLALA
jgi:hypothetical protein